MKRAWEALEAADIMCQRGMLIFSMNRIYYAMFYAVQALLISDKMIFSKHGQVKGYFNKAYVKTGVFPLELGRIYNRAFEYRQKFDYVDFAQPEEKTVLEFMGYANAFLSAVKAYFDEKRPDISLIAST